MNTFVLKSYQGPADSMFREEVKVFQSIGREQGVIGFYGSYIQNKTFNILYEYADLTLENFFHQVKPPSNGEDVVHFWTRMLKVIEAMMAVHGLSPINEHPSSRLQNSKS
jgi:hypothetical protein